MDNEGNYSATGTPTKIFKFENESDGVFSANFTWNPETEGSFTYTMDEAALKNQIQLSRTFVLDTKTEHDAFRIALTANIVARVTDGTVTQ